jgi:vanillate O-demethylase ferredoxin subunit
MLPPFSAGAHLEIRLPDNMLRHYSLLNSPDERHRYLIAVRKQEPGRGGSRYMHEMVHVGDQLRVGMPRNNFPLEETARRSVLIAGGIGITPLMSMIARLEALRREWVLHYAARGPAHAPLLDLVQTRAATHAGRVHIYFDHTPGQPALDMAALIASRDQGDHFYCCGPAPMMEAFEVACQDLPRSEVHVEYFGAPSVPASRAAQKAAAAGAFEVEFRRSGRTLSVPADASILDVALEAGISAPFSCGEGFCGSCRTAVLEGEPEHRDSVLGDADRDAGNVMLICCSRSRGARLVLDL